MSSPLIHVASLDVDSRYENEFGAWYGAEHLPSLLERDGWREVRQYRCLDAQPRHLSIFDLDEQACAGSPSASPLGNAFWGRRIRNYHARTLRRIFALGEDPADADLINLITVDIEAAHAEAFSRWYNQVHVPEMVACPGWLGAERYESLDGDPRFMAIYGLEDESTPFATDAYEAALGWDAYGEQIRGYHGFRIYRLDRGAR
jgi:hypothetical protein